jgi:hypothetical protein
MWKCCLDLAAKAGKEFVEAFPPEVGCTAGTESGGRGDQRHTAEVCDAFVAS